ncbi:MAG: MGMT family protein [Gammaproteobacteria bacterium]|nr:MGMT family protein [Gammaproteobacteria bacterium]
MKKIQKKRMQNTQDSQDDRNDRRIAVLVAVSHVPHGKVATYGQIAEMAGLPGRSRFVGSVLAHATEDVPWHRIIRSDGRIAERSSGKDLQINRLRQEGIRVIEERVRLQDFQFSP